MKCTKFARWGAYDAPPDSLVDWRGDQRLRRLYSRAFGTRLRRLEFAVPFYVLGASYILLFDPLQNCAPTWFRLATPCSPATMITYI